MSCTVTLCDSVFIAITYPAITITAYDSRAATIIASRNNTTIVGGWGAILPVGATDIYDVVIDTTGTPYVAPALEDFSGAGAPQLDVVLFSTAGATSAVGRSPGNATQFKAYIANQPWPEEAKIAISKAIGLLAYLRRFAPPTLPPPFPGLSRHLEVILRDARIDPDLVY